MNNHIGKGAVRLIAVGPAHQQTAAAKILKQVLENCGYMVAEQLEDCLTRKADYVILPAETFSSCPGEIALGVLLPEEVKHLPGWAADHAREFNVCVLDYDVPSPLSEPQQEGCRFLTYSMESDNADFTVRGIRETGENELAFEVVGVGVIGRVRLQTSERKQVKAALVAASGALACGIPFAQVLETLNHVKIPEFQKENKM